MYAFEIQGIKTMQAYVKFSAECENVFRKSLEQTDIIFNQFFKSNLILRKALKTAKANFELSKIFIQ